MRTGLASKLTYGDAAARYDIRTDVHSHARCLGCGRVDDIEAAPTLRWLPAIRTRNFTAAGSASRSSAAAGTVEDADPATA